MSDEKCKSLQEVLIERLMEWMPDAIDSKTATCLVDQAIHRALNEPTQVITRPGDGWRKPEVGLGPSVFEMVTRELMEPILTAVLVEWIHDNRELILTRLESVVVGNAEMLMGRMLSGMFSGVFASVHNALVSAVASPESFAPHAPPYEWRPSFTMGAMKG